MSKFKAGDRVQIIGYRELDAPITRNRIGKYGTVKSSGSFSDIEIPVEIDEENDWWWFDEGDVKLISDMKNTAILNGKTYRLTPHAEREQITIDGVVYDMEAI